MQKEILFSDSKNDSLKVLMKYEAKDIVKSIHSWQGGKDLSHSNLPLFVKHNDRNAVINYNKAESLRWELHNKPRFATLALKPKTPNHMVTRLN